MKHILIIGGLIFSLNCLAQQPVYSDTPFWQDQSEYVIVKTRDQKNMKKVLMDRNEVIQISSRKGLLKPSNKYIVTDNLYRPHADMRIRDMIIYKNQFVYLTDRAILSDAWAGKLYIEHDLSDAQLLAGGEDFDFLLASGNKLEYIKKDYPAVQYGFLDDAALKAIEFDDDLNGFWILTSNNLRFFDPIKGTISHLHKGKGFTDIEVLENNKELLVTSMNGYSVLIKKNGKVKVDNDHLPCNNLSCVEEIDGKLWFGSEKGAFMQKDDGQFNYYASKRWLPDDRVKHISKGSGNDVLILTSGGMATISFRLMTLYDKARFYEKQVRKRHIRNGFNCDTYSMTVPGDLSSGTMVDSDNDGLWTSMYLASQLFRYKVTGSEEALQNSIESFEAMERLHDINGIEGFPSRSYERAGYAINGLENWHLTSDSLWEWKGTTSSDEAIGHYFAYALIAEIIEDKDVTDRAIDLIEKMTEHIIENDLYFVDIDGKPTRWAKWNPDYVNSFDKSVGDRKLNSSNIIAFLQTAYHYTGKEKYKEKAYELMDEHGYLKNLKRPMSKIGVSDENEFSLDLSEFWNHSDDEMYFLSYWYLYPYAFTPNLQKKYKEAIRDHWDIERPEKDALWNFCYAMTGAEEFDLEESVWFLKEYPLDMINWTISNSHRKDIELLPVNFRKQKTTKVLPPDERPMFKHNTNCFELDRDGKGMRENSGDLYLLPYWMGRYLGVISEPKSNTQ